MLTQENEYYVRLILLMIRCGTSVLRLIFMQKLTNQCLQLHYFLQVNKGAISRLKDERVLSLKQFNIVYPSNGNITDIDKWDISLLSCLLLNLLDSSLQPSEKKAIECIRTLRNDLAAHHPDACVDTRTFARKWNKLDISITHLSKGLSVLEQSNIGETIRCIADDPIDIKRAIQDMQDKVGTTDQFFEHISQQLEELKTGQEGVQADIREMKDLLKNGNPDICIMVVGEITVRGRDHQEVIKASNILREHATKYIGFTANISLQFGRFKSTIFALFDRLKRFFKNVTNTESSNCDSTSGRQVGMLVQDINNLGGQITDVKEGSVLLYIACFSASELIGVLEYFQSSGIEQQLNDIAECLSKEVGCRIYLSARIQEQQLREDLRCIREQMVGHLEETLSYDSVPLKDFSKITFASENKNYRAKRDDKINIDERKRQPLFDL